MARQEDCLTRLLLAEFVALRKGWKKIGRALGQPTQASARGNIVLLRRPPSQEARHCDKQTADGEQRQAVRLWSLACGAYRAQDFDGPVKRLVTCAVE